MARMHSRKKGKSGSTRPEVRKKQTWIKYNSKEIEALVEKLGKSEMTASKIGIELRDSYGIPDVKAITKKKITQILKEKKLGTKLPEDLINLIKKHISLTNHRENNKQDMSAKRGFQLTESKINRLVKYYKKTNKLPKDWKFDRSKSKLLVE
ncbi:30S ribosomal protein S15 [Candidatus Woesearchaeota archaeon]|jgi:small subunit ribosomal protein S15|nr:30S ribosomal protein S15 [Candidatus Woesearchaeota archaeon]